MKWLIFALFALNILTLIVGIMIREPAEAAVSEPAAFQYRDVDSLEIVKGRRVAALAEQVTSNQALARARCEMVGPFSQDAEAEAFIERLASLDIQSDMRSIKVPAGTGYWVIQGPLKSEKAAYEKLRELQASKIDSFLIPDGELANSISLGFFTNMESAELHQKRLALKKVDSTIVERERTNRQIWVMLGLEDSRQMTSLTWDRVFDDDDKLSRRQNLCSDVASG